jgi:hypothetical protein
MEWNFLFWGLLDVVYCTHQSNSTELTVPGSRSQGESSEHLTLRTVSGKTEPHEAPNMGDSLDEDLRRRTWELLQPGEIELDGLVVHTGLEGSEEPEMHQATVEVGEIIATHAGHDPQDTFVYSGTDDSEFASNQHQGRTLADETFVWECQQLLRNGSFDVVFYFEADADTERLVADARAAGYEVTAVRGDADSPETAVFQV